jgi:hypothetical protein
LPKGDGGIGDLLTLGAGGSQKVFGSDGALKNISSGGFKTMAEVLEMLSKYWSS